MINKPNVAKTFLIAGGLLLAWGGVSFAKHTTTAAGDFANGIMSSRHNLSSSGIFHATANAATVIVDPMGPPPGFTVDINWATSEACVFCHTPHFANKGDGPLWNRSMAGGTIKGYGKTIAGNDDGSASMFSTLACLSCHDGVTTFDSLINRPGKDLATGDQNWNFGMHHSKTPEFTASGTALDKFTKDSGATCETPTCHAQPSGLFNRVSSLIVGEQVDFGAGMQTDLTNDHPIGVIYRGADETGRSASLRPRSTVLSSINLDIGREDGSFEPALVGGNLWAVKGFVSDSATIQDLLRSGDGVSSGSYVQCASCHDPHFKNLTNPDRDHFENAGWDGYLMPGELAISNHDDPRADGLFLRRIGGNSDSGVCRTCHSK